MGPSREKLFIGEAEPASVASVEATLERRGDELRKRFERLTAIGIGNAYGTPWPGSDDEAAFLVVVYVERRADIPEGPHEVDGIPIRFKVTGPIGRPVKTSPPAPN
jgi:hypothetical protein